MPEPHPDDEPKRFRVERKRLGKIVSLKMEDQYGFIEAEDFRDDVFFHFQVWETEFVQNGVTTRVAPELLMWVEFELDDDHLSKTRKLRATAVRPTNRPTGRRLSGRDATFEIVTHHPRARRKRPSWRK